MTKDQQLLAFPAGSIYTIENGEIAESKEDVFPAPFISVHFGLEEPRRNALLAGFVEYASQGNRLCISAMPNGLQPTIFLETSVQEVEAVNSRYHVMNLAVKRDDGTEARFNVSLALASNGRLSCRVAAQGGNEDVERYVAAKFVDWDAKLEEIE